MYPPPAGRLQGCSDEIIRLKGRMKRTSAEYDELFTSRLVPELLGDIF